MTSKNFLIKGSLFSYYSTLVICLIALSFALYKYEDNHLFFSCVIIFILIWIFILNYIATYSLKDDVLMVEYKKFLNIFSQKRVFLLSDIKRIEADLRHDKKSTATANMLTLFTPIVKMSLSGIKVELKTGKVVEINSEIYREELFPLFDYIKKNTDIEVEIITE